MKYNRVINALLLLLLVAGGFACKTKSDIEAFKDATYSLQAIDKLELNGVDLLRKKSASDFSFSDAAVLFSAFSDNKLNATSTLGLNVDLPEGSEDRTMTVTQLKWQLLVGDQQTLSGVVNQQVELKDGFNSITVNSPLQFTSDAEGKTDLNQLLRLATLLNRQGADKPKVSLQIKPTILTSVGPFELPTYINIKD